MPSPQPPLILVDNVFDRISLYPAATLSALASVVGREVQYTADYRRERTYWQAATSTAGYYVESDLGAGNTAAPDALWIDRGHNLWGRTVRIYDENTSIVGSPTQQQVTSLTVPAFGTVGGDPTTTTMCVTEEGALYSLYTGFTPQRFHAVYFPDSFQPVLTGVILGKRTQLLNFSSVRDEDAGERSNRVEKSLVPGYDGRDRQYARRTINLKLSTIGAAEYDSSIRSLRRLLFEVDQPAVVVHNYGANPERAWLYQYEGTNWSSPMTRVLRDLGLPLSEVGPVIR
jgi:hypothetical protein